MIHPHIREARSTDSARIMEMGQRFVKESVYGRLFDIKVEGVRSMVELAQQHGTIFVADLDGHLFGMLGLVACISPLTGELIVEELAWWVEPEHRKGRVGPLLLGAAEAWTTTKSASMLKLVAPAGSEVGKFLERRGYTAVETAFIWRPQRE